MVALIFVDTLSQRTGTGAKRADTGGETGRHGGLPLQSVDVLCGWVLYGWPDW
ncbi:hypothetical protein [Chthonomonas calidirosea]|uniref:hypothetical protein n=1 Tax=Chthonomonas calidirosea TaxID=454171 RepID=UPI0012DD624D|nr:hypothetical protein [Chthonomonas calidirosea]